MKKTKTVLVLKTSSITRKKIKLTYFKRHYFHGINLRLKTLVIISIIPTIFFFITGAVSMFFHGTFEEFDGVMMILAAKELYSGHGYGGWTSISWPPLYSVVVGLFLPFMDGFTAGKLISIVSGTLILLLIPIIVKELGITNPKHSLLIQSAVALNPLFFHYSIIVENHQLEALLIMGCIVLLLRIVNHSADLIEVLKIHGKSLIMTAWHVRVRDLWLLGIVMGLAGLTRYTSYVVLPVAFGVILYVIFAAKRVAFHQKDESLHVGRFFLFMMVLVFLPFVAVSLPWYVLNTMENGWFLANSSHLNIGFAVVEHFHRRWWWKTMASYPTLFDIVTRHPIAYLRNFVDNVLSLPWEFLYLMGWFLPLLLATTWHGIRMATTRRSFVVMLSILFLYTLGISQAFFLSELFIIHVIVLTMTSMSMMLKAFVGVFSPDVDEEAELKLRKGLYNSIWKASLFFCLYSMMTMLLVLQRDANFTYIVLLFVFVFFPSLIIGVLLHQQSTKPDFPYLNLQSSRFTILNRFRFLKRFFSPSLNHWFRILLFAMLILLPLGFSTGMTVIRLNDYLTRQDEDSGSLADYRQITAFLKHHDAHLSEKYIMAGHPAYAYYCNARFIKLPSYFEGSLEELVTYKGLDPKILNFAPKYPSHLENATIFVDYLIFNRHNAKYLPQFSFLLNPRADGVRLPPSFILIYLSDKAAVYQIIHDSHDFFQGQKSIIIG